MSDILIGGIDEMIKKVVVLLLAAILAAIVVPAPVSAQRPCFVAVVAANDGWFDGTAVRFQRATEQALLARNVRVAERDAWEMSSLWGALASGQANTPSLNGLCKVVRVGFTVVERAHSASQLSFPNFGTTTQRTVITVELDAKLIVVGAAREVLFSRTEVIHAQEASAGTLSVTIGNGHFSTQRSSSSQVRFQVLEFVARWLVDQMGNKIY